MRLVAECPVDGWVNVDDALLGFGRASLTRVTVDCPICGRGVRAVDAFYVSSGPGDDTTLSPNSLASEAQLRRLQTALEWAEREIAKDGADVEEVKRKLTKTIEKEAPSLGRAVDAVLSTRGASIATWITVLLMLVQMFLGGQQPPVMTHDDIVQIVDEIEKQHHEPPAETPEVDPENRPASDR